MRAANPFRVTLGSSSEGQPADMRCRADFQSYGKPGGVEGLMSSRRTIDAPPPALGGEQAAGLFITQEETPGGVRLTVSGELDLGSVWAADDALRRAEADTRLLVLDLRDLAFMDATGLAVVFDAGRRARETGRRFVVRVRSSGVRRLFELSRAERSLEIVVDPEAPAM